MQEQPSKICTKCGNAKPISEFATYTSPPYRAGKPREGCKPCMRAYARHLRWNGQAKARTKAQEAARHLRRFYALDASRYDALAPCRRPLPPSARKPHPTANDSRLTTISVLPG
jgi:hypothetical protein